MIDIKNPFGHILYEIEMYLLTYKIIPGDQIINNLIIESRAVHLRNLAVFFYREKTKGYWYVGDYINDVSAINLLSDEALFKNIKKYSSRATAHLSDDRLQESYKTDTMECYEQAKPVIVDAINGFFVALDNVIKPQYKTDWLDEKVQDLKNQILLLLL